MRDVIQEVVAGPLAFAQLADVLDGDEHVPAARLVCQRHGPEAQRRLLLAAAARVIHGQAASRPRPRCDGRLHDGGIIYDLRERGPHQPVGTAENRRPRRVRVRDALILAHPQDAVRQPVHQAPKGGAFETFQDVLRGARRRGGLQAPLQVDQLLDQAIPAARRHPSTPLA